MTGMAVTATTAFGADRQQPLRSRPSRRASNKLQRSRPWWSAVSWPWPHLSCVLQPTQTLGQPPRSGQAGAPPASTARRFPYFFRTDKKKAPSVSAKCLFFLPILVGANGLEPSTPTMSRWCSNQLSYAPAKPQTVAWVLDSKTCFSAVWRDERPAPGSPIAELRPNDARPPPRP